MRFQCPWKKKSRIPIEKKIIALKFEEKKKEFYKYYLDCEIAFCVLIYVDFPI